MKKIICFTLLVAAIATQSSFTYCAKPVQDDDNRKAIAKRILDNNLAEKYDAMREDFSTSLKEQLPTEKIASVWKQINDSAGPFQKVLSTNTIVTQGYHQVIIRCQFKNDNLTLEVTFNQEDKVFGVMWKP